MAASLKRGRSVSTRIINVKHCSWQEGHNLLGKASRNVSIGNSSSANAFCDPQHMISYGWMKSSTTFTDWYQPVEWIQKWWCLYGTAYAWSIYCAYCNEKSTGPPSPQQSYDLWYKKTKPNKKNAAMVENTLI